MLLLLCASIPLFDVAKSQKIADLQKELRRLGCQRPHCISPLTCNALQMRAVTTDFGLISCVPSAPFDQLSEVTLDGNRLALAADNLTLPAGATLQNVTIVSQPFVRHIDMSLLTNVDNAVIADNAALISLVVVGGCVRVFNNPRLAIVVFASPMLTRFVELLNNALVASLDFANLGSQFNELKLIALNSLTSITGLRGRTMSKVTIVDNPQLLAADELDFATDLFFNVSENPKLNGFCRARSLNRDITDGCAFDAPCMVAIDRCMISSGCKPATKPGRCSTALSTAPTCPPPPPISCPPYSLRFSTFSSSSLARARDVGWCVTLGAPLAPNVASTCSMNFTSTASHSFGEKDISCTMTLWGNGNVRSFSAGAGTNGALSLSIQSVAPSTECSLRLTRSVFTAQQNLDLIITSMVVFDGAAPTTTTTTTRTTTTTTTRAPTFTNLGTSTSITKSIDGSVDGTTTAPDDNATLSVNVETPSSDNQQMAPTAKAMELEVILGIVAGALVLLAIVTVLWVWWVKRRNLRKREERHEPLQPFQSARYSPVPQSPMRMVEPQVSSYDTVPSDRRPTNNYASMSMSDARSNSPPPSTYTALPMVGQAPQTFTNYQPM